MTQTQKKTNAIFKLMEHFLTQKEISSYDENILEEFGCDKKTLERYLHDIEENYTHIITLKKSRKKYWKLVSVSDIFEAFIKNSYDLTNLFDLAENFDPEIFKELEKGTFSKLSKCDENVFLFKNSMMEELGSQRVKANFKQLKEAIKKHEYRDIYYTYDETMVEKNVKCLKLMFMDNNWYLVLVNEKKELRFQRLSFIDEVKYAQKNMYAKKEVEVYISFLRKVQNSMTLYGVSVKKATLKATPNIAKYFEKEMKRFLPSQKFQEKCEDGSILFSLEYTQALEILPFVQKWLPDLVIVSPLELKEAYVKKLEETLKNHL
jgi:predicted DNA-binding transcriptional regulator YafY